MRRVALRRVLLLALGAWALTIFAPSTRAALVGHWTFDDSASPYADASGFGNDGVEEGSGTLTAAAGQVGSGSLEFDGAARLNVGSSSVFDTQSYTVSAWVNKGATAGSSWRVIAGDWDAGWMHFGQHSSGTFSNHVRVDGAQKDMIGTSAVKTDQWQHVVSVVDKSNKRLQLWVDGVKESETTLPTWGSTNVPGTTDVRIGTPYASGAYTWVGKLDDVGLWSEPLTKTQIQNIRYKGLHGVDLATPSVIDGLIAHYTFDDAGSPYADAAGGHDGTLNTAPGTAGQAAGKIGSNALEMYGSGEIAVSNAEGDFNTQTYTVSAWLSTDTLSGWRTAVGDWTGGTWMHFGLDDGTYNDKWSDYGANATASTTTAQTGQWYHVVSVRRAGGPQEIWINGVKEAEISGGTPNLPGTEIFIGTKGGGGNMWEGKIDDIGIWGRALSNVEIAEIFLKGKRGVDLAGTVALGPPSSASGLVSYWDFEGRTTDTARHFQHSSGTVDDNLAINAGNVSYTSGRVGQAADLHGGYFTAASSADVQLPDTFTIEAWINPDQVNVEWQRLVLNWGGTGQNAYHFAIHNGLVSLYVTEADGHGLEVAVGGDLVAGQWQHVAAVLDSATLTGTVYLNGIEVGSGAFDGTIFTTTAEGLGIGDSMGIPSGGARYSGLLDELAIWNVALTPDQIASHFLGGAAGYGLAVPEPSTLALLALGALGLVLPLGRRRK